MPHKKRTIRSPIPNFTQTFSCVNPNSYCWVFRKISHSKCRKNALSVRKNAILFAYIRKKQYFCSVNLNWNILRPLGNVPISTAVVKSLLTGYSNPNAKIKLWVEQGYLVPLKRGLYIVSPEITQQEPCLELIANHMYMPSYVSLQYALRQYGLIPERVRLITSITTCHARSFSNALGSFTYYNVSRAYFAPGIISKTEGAVSYMIASPEKALVDTILFTSKVPGSLVGLEQFLEEDVRFDMDALHTMNIPLLQAIADVAPKHTIMQNLITLCQR